MIDFIHPCPNTRLTSKFGPRKHPVTGKVNSLHKGCDFAKSGHIPILASADGVVKQYIGDGTTYGKVIFIQHAIKGKRYDTTYAHLKSKLVKDGEKVKQGQIIGYMGNTGGSTGQHLHFEIHDGPWKSGQPNAVDPLLYIDKKKEPIESEEDKMLKEQVAELTKEVEKLKAIVDSMKDTGKPEAAPWAKESSDWAKKNGITDGTRPSDKVTRQEVWKMLHSMFKLK